MQEVAAIHASKVFLAPLMVVAGDHAINDLCGEEEDSWKSCFEQAGYQTSDLKGLGEYLLSCRIYLELAYSASNRWNPSNKKFSSDAAFHFS